jgi:hypothetical protein
LGIYPPYPLPVIYLTDNFYFNASVVYARCYHWDNSLNDWVEGADLFGRTGEMMIAASTREIALPIVNGQDFYAPFLAPVGTHFSQVEQDYAFLYGKGLQSLDTTQFSIYLTFEMWSVVCHFNATLNEYGLVTYYDGKTPLFGTMSFADYSFRIHWVNGTTPPIITNTDTTEGPAAVPGFSIGSLLLLSGFGLVGCIFQVKRKSK